MRCSSRPFRGQEILVRRRPIGSGSDTGFRDGAALRPGGLEMREVTLSDNACRIVPCPSPPSWPSALERSWR